ncbi:hypothetical protein KGA66_08085 [Actinocrinis puniceicyclus]|uniref:PH domain-containing protein n=1 Tax=Actinocrinis puniceicyclus TaxID=977794 RepID=A0A8J7WNC4_9ACTN|nr:hypothetical protein [Actinocrinis puniceicyclus]MBS2962999.1 hypothetical protein [Actinocrinis puniceicyclus]
MRRLWWYALSAALGIASEVAISVIANQFTISKRYYLAPVGLFALLCLLTASVDYLRDVRHGGPRAKQSGPTGPVPVRGTDRIVLRRSWEKEIGRLALLYLTAIEMILLDLLVVTRHLPSRVTLVERWSLDGAVVTVLAVLWSLMAWWVARTRPGVIVSGEGVLVFTVKGKRVSLPWRDVTDIRTETARSATWLVARVPAGSRFVYQAPTTEFYNAKRGLLELCDLRRIGLTRHQVDAALDARRP